ncbi:MAG: hypothetical protein HOP19_24200 [Acidobacteria bacterium]|nr:hypothetical protein [Acidobacteriota bacterium]
MAFVEEDYLPVLQNLEFAYVTCYKNNARMNDHAALFVVEQLIKSYHAETQGRTYSPAGLQPHEQEAFDSVKAMCEFNLGRQALGYGADAVNIPEGQLTVEELLACLKRIKKSIEFWQKRGGRRQYFEFISGFIK